MTLEQLFRIWLDIEDKENIKIEYYYQLNKDNTPDIHEKIYHVTKHSFNDLMNIANEFKDYKIVCFFECNDYLQISLALNTPFWLK